MPDGSAGGGFSTFQHLLLTRVGQLAEEWSIQNGVKGISMLPQGQSHFVVPIALVMVVDEANGGDVTAQELVRRFNLLHLESGKALDFYFMGWEWINEKDRAEGIRFDLDKFQECRNVLKSVGITSFGGNADLILVDADHWYTPGISPIDINAPFDMGPTGVTLNFSEAIHINLASRREDKDLPPLGEFLQSIIDAAEGVRTDFSAQDAGITFRISDKLGIATAKRSFLTFILEKFGSIIGAKRLETLAVKNVGPVVPLHKLNLQCAVS